MMYASQLVAHGPCTATTPALTGCTDDSAELNAFLAQASASNPVTLIQDIRSMAAIEIPATGNVTIQCLGWNTGFVAPPGANSHIIRNLSGANAYSYSLPGNTLRPGTPGQNVVISGCKIEGNRGDGTNGNSSSGNPRQAANGNWLFGVYLDNVEHVRFLNNWVYDAPSFALLCNPCIDGVFDGNRLDAASRALNQDGLHFDGYSRYIRVANNWCNTTDDCLAFNAPEGYGGPIDGVVVANNHCAGCLTFYRQYGYTKAVSNITVTNYTGTVASVGNIPGVVFRLGEVEATSKVADVQQSFMATNIHFSCADELCYPIEVNDPIGVLDADIVWDAPKAANAAINFRSNATISSLSLKLKIYRSTAGNAAAFAVMVPKGSAIATAHLDISVENEPGKPYPAIPYLISAAGTLSNLDIKNLDPNNITALAADYTHIANIYGTSLAAANWQVPDAKVRDLVPYISDGSGRGKAGHFCVKRSGRPRCL
jgi:hypothetical protein